MHIAIPSNSELINTFTLFDTLGKKVLEKQITLSNSSEELSITNLENGVYFWF
ncbi:MAG: T9SS type A sorting domain-containing protein [Flavobacterium sp.]|nr:T9SS type A sorting domain-containing protein [Flavobacterium sp.]